MARSSGNLDFTIKTPNGWVKVSGINAVSRALRDAGVSAADLRAITKPIAKDAAEDARRRAPVGPTGRLSSRATGVWGTGSRTRARIKTGSKSVPYGTAQEKGRYYSNGTRTAPKNFMRSAAYAARGKALEAYEKGIRELIKKTGLKVR